MNANQTKFGDVISKSGCFDLQFRRDVRHERTGAPAYYRWKAQFVLALPKTSSAVLDRLRRAAKCGRVYITGNQARWLVQNVQELHEALVPFVAQQILAAPKKKEFLLWKKAVAVVYRNKGKALAKWAKHDLEELITIKKSSSSYKHNPKESKWLEMAQLVAQNREKE